MKSPLALLSLKANSLQITAKFIMKNKEKENPPEDLNSKANLRKLGILVQNYLIFYLLCNDGCLVPKFVIGVLVVDGGEF